MQDILRETPIYQEILEQGRLEALRELLLKVVQVHFPDPKITRLAKGQSTIIEDPELLQNLILKVSMAETSQEAQLYLLDWSETDKKND